MPKFLTSFPSSACAFKLIIWVLIAPLFYSCSSSKSLTYFKKDSAVGTRQSPDLAAIEQIPLRIQPNDILAIVVSSLSDESNALFNTLNTSSIITSSFPGAAPRAGQPIGYPVDENGEVNLPLVGKVRLAGMTLQEASNSVKEYLSQFIKDPSINVRLLNHKFTVIGEVNRPGIYNLLENRTTLPEVIGIAGELTIYGRRNNVMLIRTINNKREVMRLDLTSRQVLNSPYYFIENNDVVYIEAGPGRGTFTDRTLQLIPTSVALITTTLLLYSTFIK